jgi:hypothetical protein
MRFWDRKPRKTSSRLKQPVTTGRTGAASTTLKQRTPFSNPLDPESYGKTAPWPETNTRVPDVEPIDVSPGGEGEISRNADAARYVYNISNLATDRTYDANASSVAELADILGTLIRDLAAGNKISVDL